MSRLHFRRGARALAAVAVVVASGAACRPDRATLFEPTGPNSYDFHLTNAASVSAAGLPQGTLTVIKNTTAADTVRVDLNHLHRLTSGVYQVWIADTTGGDVANIAPLTGSVRVITTNDDGTADTVTTNGVSSFAESGANVAIRLTANTASFGSNPAANAHNVVFVTIESAAGATTPSDIRPLWAAYTVTTPTARTVVSKAFTFGTFTNAPAGRYAYFINGHGLGGVRGSTLIVDDTALARPPRGYYYGAFLVSGDGADTLYLGELTAPFPRRNVSLRDADVSVVDPVVETNPPVLRYASILFEGSTAGLTGTLPYEGLDNFIIALLLKQQGQAGELPPNAVTTATLPTIVTEAPTEAAVAAR